MDREHGSWDGHGLVDLIFQFRHIILFLFCGCLLVLLVTTYAIRI